MDRIRRIPLQSILKRPDNLTAYLQLNNQYWAIDTKDNVLFAGCHPIYAPSKRSISLYITRLQVSEKYTLVCIQKAWVKQSAGYSMGNGGWKT